MACSIYALGKHVLCSDDLKKSTFYKRGFHRKVYFTKKKVTVELFKNT